MNPFHFIPMNHENGVLKQEKAGSINIDIMLTVMSLHYYCLKMF